MAVTPITVVTALGSTLQGAPGCFTTLQWNASGDPKGTVELLRNFVPIHTRGIGPATYNDPFAVGTWTYQIRATNSDGVVTSTAPVQVTPACLTEYKFGFLDCGNSAGCVRHMWKVLGNQSGTVRIIHTPTSVLVAAVPITSPNHIHPETIGCPNLYRIVVTVGNWSVTTPVTKSSEFDPCEG
jgi:hypothetical protein